MYSSMSHIGTLICEYVSVAFEENHLFAVINSSVKVRGGTKGTLVPARVFSKLLRVKQSNFTIMLNQEKLLCLKK